MGARRAIADLGGAIEHELGPNLSNYSDTLLKKMLKEAKPIGYSTQRNGPGVPDHVVLSSEALGCASILTKDEES
jgi:hypothetical protein